MGKDLEVWSRTANDGSRLREIDQLLQKLAIVQSGFAAADFEARTQAELLDAAENDHVRKLLLRLALAT